ncbi:MAG TPA: ankyrin repeat domain-containing protein [Luteitalea sp.]|nr:ankyrin repeat domain-containing protein [Luteitalea sp.]
MSDALPIAPGSTPSDYAARSALLAELPSADESALRAWTTDLVAAAATARRVTADTEPVAAAERLVPLLARKWQQRLDQSADAPVEVVARDFVADAHGFANWAAFEAHLAALADPASDAARFEQAADAIVDGDIDGLRAILSAASSLVHARSTRAHGSTLLHYVAANGIEDFRQKTPGNIVDIATLLLDAGSDVNAESAAYGGGATALGLASTSIHPQRAGVQIALLDVLLARGAWIDRPGVAGNRHGAVLGCLANGQPAAAAHLAAHGSRLSLVEAAGVGRGDDVERLLPGAAADDVQTAFMYAAGYGHLAVAQRLLEAGADASAGDARGETALHWASGGFHADVVEMLLAHGARVAARDTTWDATPLDWTLYSHTTDRDQHRWPQAREVVRRLLAAGATFRGEWWGPRLLAALQRDTELAAILAAQSDR